MLDKGIFSPQPKLQVILLFPANATCFASAKSPRGLGEEKGAGNQTLSWGEPGIFGAAVDIYLHQQTLVTREGSSPSARAHVLPMASENGHFPVSKGRDVIYVKHLETLSWEAPQRGMTQSNTGHTHIPGSLAKAT